MPIPTSVSILTISLDSSAAINILENEGVVRREPSTNDRRSVKVVITDKGWNEANRLNPIAQELSREILSCLEKEKVEDLVDTMRNLRENLLPRIAKTSENGRRNSNI